ncbi:pimelyl-ACP methyl ester esterase BioV [Arcobacteraceae bacterium]|nr:pimelyl-ACP methyl ester esterase BioV [Arcobacteraceae bacterium]
MFFSGFSLSGEQELFHTYLEKSDFVVSGFSYGAIKALEYVLTTSKRIDKVQLFSPAYFNDKDKKYKRMQLMYFKKDSLQYCDNFLQNSGFPQGVKSRYFSLGKYEELEELLNYKWDKVILQKLISKNIKLEVYLGGDDQIVDPSEALEFFRQFGEVYYIKNKGHIL